MGIVRLRCGKSTGCHGLSWVAREHRFQIFVRSIRSALNVAHYQMKYGDLPLEETLAMIDADEPNDDQAKLLANGMENLVGVLGAVCSGLGEAKH